jgi:hypothetical protein
LLLLLLKGLLLLRHVCRHCLRQELVRLWHMQWLQPLVVALVLLHLHLHLLHCLLLELVLLLLLQLRCCRQQLLRLLLLLVAVVVGHFTHAWHCIPHC